MRAIDPPKRPQPIVHLLLCHEPVDQGATTPTGFSERQLAADVNGCISSKLQAGKISCWRHEQDTLARRLKWLKKASGASPWQVVLEVHFNSAPDPEYRGFQTLAYAHSPHSMRLATCVQSAMRNLCSGLPDLGVCGCARDKRYVGTEKEFGSMTRLALLEDTPQWACIPEPAFLSNKKDVEWVMKFDNRRKLGYAIAQGIKDFLETLTLEA